MTHKNLINFHGKMMINMAKELYPINRSITGEGVRKTLDLIKKKVPLKKKILEINFTIQLIDSVHLKNQLLN